MKKIIITDNSQRFDERFQNVQILNPNDFNETAPDSWSNYEYEFLPYLICEHIKGPNLIIAIDFSIQHIDKYLVAHHLITSLNPTLFFFSENEVELLHLESDYGLFKNKPFKVLTEKRFSELFNDELELDRFNSIFQNNFDYNTYKENYQKTLVLDRHQASNEWGAAKLLLNHGASLKEIESQYQLPKTIYFKQKLKEHNIDHSLVIDKSLYAKKDDLDKEKKKFLNNIQKVKKILLVDDNANRGWSFALEKIFNCSPPDIKVNFEEGNAITDYSIFDLIFLDLRLPFDSKDIIPKISYGYELIRKIKGDERSLHIPLIIFTASQKASTLNDIIEEGADAMYVKESPDLSVTESLNNYFDFISELNFQIEKGEHLKKYAIAIQKIKGELLPEIIDKGGLKLKSRIIERLEMFYGLIKTRYELSSYNNKKYHFSSDVLSFITLWSILNEIQECYFEKGVGQSYTKIKDYPNNPQSFINVELDNWKLKNHSPERYFIVEKPIIEEDISPNGSRYRPNKDYIKKDTFSDFQITRKPPFFEFDSNGFKLRRVNYKTLLSLQIAFILLSHDSFRQSSNIESFLKTLKDLNEQRNRLYITHGEDISSNFHSQLESDKVLHLNAIPDLFKLVAFLLSSNETIVM